MKGTHEISALHASKRHKDWVITKAATVGIKNWFKRQQSPLSSSVQEDRLLYSSASDMMAVKHKTNKNAVKAATPMPLVVVAVSTKSLKLLGTLHTEDS
jgi:hypothetical protein